MLLPLSFATYSREIQEEQAALAGLITTIERSAHLALPAHRTSDRKLSILQTTAAGRPWALQSSFCLYTVDTYNELLDALYQSV